MFLDKYNLPNSAKQLTNKNWHIATKYVETSVHKVTLGHESLTDNIHVIQGVDNSSLMQHILENKKWKDVLCFILL